VRSTLSQAPLKSEAAALVMLESARRNLLPRFDFQVQASAFGGEGENLSGSFFGIHRRWPAHAGARMPAMGEKE